MVVQHITDADDIRLADYRELRDASARKAIEGDELFVAEGPVAIERLIASDHRVRSLLIAEPKLERLAYLVDSVDADVFAVPKSLMHDIVGFNMHRGAIAAGDRREHTTLAELIDTSRRIVVLEGLNDPENLGAVARSARAFGIDGFVLDPTCIDPYTRRTVRVSMGEILHLRGCRVDAGEWPEALATMKSGGFETWAMTPADRSESIWTLNIPEKLAIVFGAEGPGLADKTMNMASRRVCLPIASDVDSLNVGAAAAATFAIVTRPD